MNELSPKSTHQHYRDSNREQEASPESVVALHNTLDTFLTELQPRSSEDLGDGWSFRSYDATLPDGSYLVNINGAILYHDKLGVVQRTLLRIDRGATSAGTEMSSDFGFIIEDVAAMRGDKLELDDNGTVVAGSDERYSFSDTVRIDERKKEILKDDAFNGTSSTEAIVTPNFQVTPGGDIYQDGVEQSSETKPMSELSLGLTLRFNNENEQQAFDRKIAAWEQARKEVGTNLTEDRVDRVIDTLTRLYAQLNSTDS